MIRPASTSSGSEMKAWKNQIISQIPTFSPRKSSKTSTRPRTVPRDLGQRVQSEEVSIQAPAFFTIRLPSDQQQDPCQ